MHVYERIQRIRYQKGKLNVIKRQQNIIFRSVGFADWFVEFKILKICVKTILKINRPMKTPWHECMEVAGLRVMGSCLKYHYPREVASEDEDLKYLEPDFVVLENVFPY